MSVCHTASEADILALLLAGHSHNVVAGRLGITRYFVEKVAVAHRDAHPVLRARKANGVPPPMSISCPGWVRRAGLASDFYDIARATDEFEAARHCRALMAEGRRMAALDAYAEGARRCRRLLDESRSPLPHEVR